MTTRSGKKTHIPEFVRRLQEQGHQKPKPVVIQKGQVYEEELKRQQPRKIVQGRKKMDVEDEGEYGIKRTRGSAQIDKVKPYNIVEIVENAQASVSIAQLLKDPKNQKELREFMRTTSYIEIADKQ